MKIKKYLILLILVSLAALVLRLWKLGSIPPSLNWDEASWGYNAYSILKTGRDEYGNLLPLIFKAFGDYKSAIYVYLTVPSIAVFGLNEFAVRFPAALFGAISVFLIFFAVREIFQDFEGKEVIGLLSSGILALSPWSYHFSHNAWEVNILLVLIFLAIIFFLKAEKKKVYSFYLSAVFFGLSFYVYSSAKLLVPLILLGLMFIFKEKLKQFSFKNYLISLVILGILVLPVAKFTFFGGAGGRLKIMSLFSYPRSNEETMEIASEEGGAPQSFTFKIFHGSIHYFLRGIGGRYLNHFSPRFLFFEGDWSNPRHSVPFAGVLNFLDVLFLPLGAYFLVIRKIKNKGLIWYLFLITPLPAVLTRDVVQATRSFFMIIPLTVVSAFGIYFVWKKIVKLKKLLRLSITWTLVLIYLFSFVYYLDQFFVHAPITYSQYWQYGYKEAVKFITDNEKKYNKVVFTQKYGQPYIYYLFYTAYEPRKYQFQAHLIENPEGDVGRVEKIDNIEFREIYWPSDRFTKNVLYIGDAYEIPLTDIFSNEARVLKDFKYLNGELAFRIVETVK